MPPVDSLMPKRPVNGPMRRANWSEKRNASVVVVVHRAVVRRLVRVRRVDVGLREARLAARVVDELDDVVLVLARLEAELDVALDGVGEEVVVAAQADDGLQAAEAVDVVVDALDDALDLVDERLVLA